MTKTPFLLHDILTISATEYPRNRAVVFKDKSISYSDLDAASNALAHCLISLGVLPGDRVGLYLDKSIDAVISIYGILKSGACYVPLDPVGPVERNALIINDCGLKIVITAANKLFKLKQIAGKKSSLRNLLIVDRNHAAFDNAFDHIRTISRDRIFHSDSNTKKPVIENIRPDGPAYILYTSGSTGQPKGVVISHAAAKAFVMWGLDTFSVQADDILSGHAPFHFDLSVFDIFVSVAAGASVCLVPQGMSAFPASLAEFIEQQKISIWYSVPSVLVQLGLHGGIENKELGVLRHILFAGEVFLTRHLKKLMAQIPSAGFFNLYGPTETNVCTWYHVAAPPETDAAIPIGKPCAGQTFLIIDENGKPLENGEVGELYVTGPTLMTGYYNDPEKTQNSFTNCPAADKGQIFYKTFYKTGDRVHVNGNGDLEYHSRCDAMIKSRGYRIEPGEIETVLVSHAAVSEAVVWGEADEAIGTLVAACVEPAPGRDITEEDLRLFCLKKLPKYMIPETIRVIDTFPRTSTGKIDRNRMKNHG
jgi:amino acid adenylation domain-containing protein